MTEPGGTRSGYRACLVAALCSALVPGAGHVAVKAKWKALTIAAAVLNLAAMVTVVIILAPVRSRNDLADVIADRAVFVALGVGLLVLAVTRLWAVIDSAWIARPRRTPAEPAVDGVDGADGVGTPPAAPTTSSAGRGVQVAAALTTALIVAAAVAPLTVAADYVWETDRTIERVFGSHEPTTANPSSTGPTTTVADSTTTTGQPFEGMARVNILLLGGDAGKGRPGLRTDSMIVVSIDPITGDTAMVSVPRNLPAMPFPAGSPLAKRFPKGFDNLANAVYGYADQHRELAGGGNDAGAQAIKSGMAELLGIPIHYYALVDMAGFRDVVDALGGVDLYVAERVPTPGNPEGDQYHKVPEYIEVGQQHMDGTLALAYARTREADSDYHRMARQRCMLAALAQAATPKSLAMGLTDLLAAFGDAVRTDIPRSRLGELTQLIDRFTKAGGIDAVRTLHLAPPTLDTNRWRSKQVRELVASTLDPNTPIPPGLDYLLPPLAEQCHVSK